MTNCGVKEVEIRGEIQRKKIPYCLFFDIILCIFAKCMQQLQKTKTQII